MEELWKDVLKTLEWKLMQHKANVLLAEHSCNCERHLRHNSRRARQNKLSWLAQRGLISADLWMGGKYPTEVLTHERFDTEQEKADGRAAKELGKDD